METTVDHLRLVDQVINDHIRERDYLASSIPGIEKAKKIQEVNAATLTESAFKKDWVENNKPCLIKGAVNHWPAIEKWRNKEYWLRTCKDVAVTLSRNNGHELQEKMDVNKIRIGFHEALNRLYDDVDHSFYIQGAYPEVLKDTLGLHFLSSSPKPKKYGRRKFLIQRRSFTTWHAHIYDEFILCQVNGAKRVILFAPNVHHDMKYVCDFLRRELYLEGESLDKKLDFCPVIADLEEGDALYIPPYWHHAVHPLHSGINFSVIHCFGSPLHKMGNFSNFFVKRNYKNLIWPINRYTPIVPLLAISAFILFTIKRMAGKVSSKYV